MSAWPWPERESCDGDEYHDVFAGDFVVGARPCLGCPACQPDLADACPACNGCVNLDELRCTRCGVRLDIYDSKGRIVMFSEHRIELFKGEGRHPWYFRIVNVRNGQTITTSEGYYSRWNLRRAVKGFNLPVRDLT